MSLRVWNLLLDPYDHEQLADNWAKVDAHDHSPGRGVLIPTEGIANEAVSFPLIASSVFPEYSAEGGELTLEAGEEKVLAGGPKLTVPATGFYEVGLQLRAEATIEHPNIEGTLRVNGSAAAIPPLFDVRFPLAGSHLKATNFARIELQEGDELTIGCAINEAATVKFSHGRLSIWRIG
jgi:hypothetical protein